MSLATVSTEDVANEKNTADSSAREARVDEFTKDDTEVLHAAVKALLRGEDQVIPLEDDSRVTLWCRTISLPALAKLIKKLYHAYSMIKITLAVTESRRKNSAEGYLITSKRAARLEEQLAKQESLTGLYKRSFSAALDVQKKIAIAISDTPPCETVDETLPGVVAAVLRERSRTTWLPIDTAPKDGTIIVTHCPFLGLVTALWTANAWRSAWSHAEILPLSSPTRWLPVNGQQPVTK